MTGSRILIIEDEPAIVRGLKDTFAAKGCEPLCATDGEAGLHLALSAKPDLVLLDIMLPKVNGYEICRAIRETGSDVPIIMLTAKGQEEDIVLGLNLGADDYVVKPFKIRELVARANAFLRRHRAPRGRCGAVRRVRTEPGRPQAVPARRTGASLRRRSSPCLPISPAVRAAP